MKQKPLFTSILATTVLIIGVVCISNFVLPKTTSAIFLEGGRSEEAQFCSCSICFKLDIGDPKDGDFMWCPWYTRTYQHYNIWPNAWQLGKAYIWIPCLQISYPYCRKDGGGYLLKMTGTSQGS